MTEHSHGVTHLVHVDPELGPPLCHGEGEGGVDGDGGEGELGVLQTELVGENGGDEGELQQGGHRVEDEGGQDKTDAPRPSVYSLGESSSLSVEMETCAVSSYQSQAGGELQPRSRLWR